MWDALLIAGHDCHLKTVDTLIRHGANPASVDSGGRNWLMLLPDRAHLNQGRLNVGLLPIRLNSIVSCLF